MKRIPPNRKRWRIIYQEERLVAILDYLQKARTMSVADICQRYTISRDTARRDIVKLVNQGAATRTHGGIALPDLGNKILAYRDRLQTYSEEKMRIGKKAVSYLNTDGCYFLNASTTISCMARQIDAQVSVFTQSLDVAELLSQQQNATVHLLGGKLNHENRFFFSMESARQIEQIQFDGVFLGTAAIAEDGIYYEDEEDAWISRLAAERSECTIILADHKKFDNRSRFKAFDWDTVDVLITDRTLPQPIHTLMETHGIQLILAN
ncbi:DeoR/GlpR family DNA-binding transcription regulator [Sporolactobacillus nakayamae]